MVGITEEAFSVAPYQEVINKEAEIIGVSDHLAQEIPRLLDLAASGKLDLSRVVSRTIALEAGEINETLDGLERFGNDLRVVIEP